ncbi:thioredoxin family protein, partial [bacterium]|nr:thioredoxin family protein [bacterium]
MRFSFFSALFLVSFLFSCASTPPPPSNQPEPPVEEKEQSLPPPPAFFELKCEDTTISLRPQSVSVPLFVIVSQQHCPPCKIIYRHAAELKKRFGERIQFTVIYNDDEEHQVDGLSVCHLKKD